MSNAFAALADVKSFIGVTSANADSLLQSLLDSSVTAFASYCNKDSFFNTTYTAYRDGNGGTKMIMVNSPITSVASVVIDGTAILPAVNGGTGYSFAPGGRLVWLNGYRFNRGIRNCVITYTAGYNDAAKLYPLPGDLGLACKMYVAMRYREKDRLGIGSRSLAGESVSYTDGHTTGNTAGLNPSGMPPAAMNILENYMNMVPESDL